MSDIFERPAAKSAVATERPSIDQPGLREFSSEPAFGRTRELRDAGYQEMPDASAAADDKSFGSDYAGLSEAADDLATSRRPSSKIVSRQYLTGDGNEADERESITLRRAAEDLIDARATDAEAIDRTNARHIRSEVDKLEQADLANVSAGEDSNLAAPNDPPLEPSEDGVSGNVQEDGQLDPIVQEALKHPQVRQAIEEQVGKADAARQSYDRALGAVGGMLREIVFAQFPELTSHTAQQFESALVQLSQRDPARYGQARALADRLSAVQTAQLLQQQQRDATQRQEFTEYAKAEDARFETMVKGEKPEVVQKVANEIITYATELGVPREQFLQLCATEPVMRNAAFQKMMFDAASYRLLQQARNEIAKKVVPPVQRPGVAVDTRAALNETDIRSLNTRFANNPSVKNAADVLAAQRRVRT